MTNTVLKIFMTATWSRRNSRGFIEACTKALYIIYYIFCIFIYLLYIYIILYILKIRPGAGEIEEGLLRRAQRQREGTPSHHHDIIIIMI